MNAAGVKMLSAEEFIKNIPDLAEFVWKRYPDKKAVYFEILLSDDEKLVCKMSYGEFTNVRHCRCAGTIVTELFTKTAVVGTITMRDIMRDALPDPAVSFPETCFIRHPQSRYTYDDPLYPVGLAYGYLFLLERKDGRAKFLLDDFSNTLSGRFTAFREKGILKLKRSRKEKESPK